MAFNPFMNFRKYRNFWMAAILLLTMITFVLCTGTQGDLSDYVMKLVRSSGPAYATLDGSSMRSQEFYDLKERRNVANEFMRTAGKYCIARMDEALKPENFKKAEQNPKDREQLLQVQALRERLEYLIRSPRFFETGVKIDDLVDFKIWLKEADRLEIELSDQHVQAMVRILLVSGATDLFGPDIYRGALYEVRRHHSRANEPQVLQALRDELRVRLAQQALGYAERTPNYQIGGARLALTPAQAWEYYKDKRVEYKISLLPLHVEDFVANVKAPEETELERLFKDHKSQSQDPTSEKPGFTIPQRVKVGWIYGDAAADHFKKAAKLAVELRAYPPLPMHQYASYSMLTAIAEKTFTADQVSKGMIAKGGKYEAGNWMDGDPDLSVAGWLTKKDARAIATLVGMGALRSDGGFVAGGSGMRSMAALGAQLHAKSYAAAVRQLVGPRAIPFASAVLLGTSNQRFVLKDLFDQIEYRKYDELPLFLFEDDMMQVVQNNHARKWVQQQMRSLRAQLENPDIRTKLTIDRAIDYAVNPHKIESKKKGAPKSDPALKPKDRTLKDLGLERGESKDYYHRFDIEEAKELEPFKKAYLAYYEQINHFEGRDLEPEKKLKDSDFWKLFFDGSEGFSITGARYQARPWPPAVRVTPHKIQEARFSQNPNLKEDPRMRQIAAQAATNDANQPVVLQFFDYADRLILFWRIDEKPAEVPENLAKVRDRVVAAWKLDKARVDAALPRAHEIAKAIQNSGTPNLSLQQALEQLKKEMNVKRELIPLDTLSEPVSPLVPVSRQTRALPQTVYGEYDLPRTLLVHPRTDTKTHVMELYDLQKPIEIGYPPLDKINKALFDEISKEKEPKGKQVQILTNKPRTVFYIAVQRGLPEVSRLGFQFTIRNPHDLFLDTAQAQTAKKVREELMKQLRLEHKLEAPSDQVRSQFDSDAVQ